MGNVIKTVDIKDYQEMLDEVNKHIEEESQQAETLATSTSFNLVYMAKSYDDWFLDPIVGFLIPGVGDIISSMAILPALYVAIFNLRSIRLVLAILSAAIIDILAGLIPVAGDIVDAFYKSNKIACRLIVGYVEEDDDTMSEINKRAVWGAIFLAIIGFLGYACYNLIMSLYTWIVSLFA